MLRSIGKTIFTARMNIKSSINSNGVFMLADLRNPQHWLKVRSLRSHRIRCAAARLARRKLVNEPLRLNTESAAHTLSCNYSGRQRAMSQHVQQQLYNIQHGYNVLSITSPHTIQYKIVKRHVAVASRGETLVIINTMTGFRNSFAFRLDSKFGIK